MPKPTLTKSLIIPSSTKIYFNLSQSAVPNAWYFINYPKASRPIVITNFLSNSFAITKLLPFFSFYLINNSIVFATRGTKVSANFSAIMGGAMSNFAKALTLSSFGFFKILQFVGFRFRQRWFWQSQSLRLRLGYSKKVWIKAPDDFIAIVKKQNPKRRINYYFSFDKEYLKKIVDFIYSYRPHSNYRGRGINIKEQPLELKEGKKTIW